MEFQNLWTYSTRFCGHSSAIKLPQQRIIIENSPLDTQPKERENLLRHWHTIQNDVIRVKDAK